MEADKPFESWVVVEVMGHQMLAGHATQEVIAGTPLLRIDVPQVEGWPGHTKYIGGGAIFRLHVVTQEHARATAAELAKKWGYSPLPVHLPDMHAASQLLQQLRQAQAEPARIGSGAQTDEEDLDYGF